MRRNYIWFDGTFAQILDFLHEGVKDKEEAPVGEGGTKNHMTDSQLIQEIKQGNTELYSELMRRYQRKILAFVYHMLKSSHMELMAEDLCSETFYKAFRSLHSFREVDASFSTWLYTIARNTVLSELRKHRSGTLPLEESGVVPVAPLEVAPEQAILRSERVHMVREAINNLPEKQRSALILREYDQLDYQEIADILGQSVSSVKSLLFRARGSVKIQLEPYFYEPVFEDLRGMKNR
ncbi:RNA polymerase sigma factor RpoE [Actinobacillus pleuropneumoniae]|nr:RNA polymerase sigma factor RpoE [Actinobacillus pleuropneumoniae]